MHVACQVTLMGDGEYSRFVCRSSNTRHIAGTTFVISAFFAGVAGGFYALYITFIDPSSFTIMESITILLTVLLGGFLVCQVQKSRSGSESRQGGMRNPTISLDRSWIMY